MRLLLYKHIRRFFVEKLSSCLDSLISLKIWVSSFNFNSSQISEIFLFEFELPKEQFLEV